MSFGTRGVGQLSVTRHQRGGAVKCHLLKSQLWSVGWERAYAWCLGRFVGVAWSLDECVGGKGKVHSTWQPLVGVVGRDVLIGIA